MHTKILLKSYINATEKITLLFTGPLTDLAKALTVDPTITEHIERLVWMGGTFLSKGNVEEPEHDGTAEWNAFWDPEAVKTVFDTDIKIDMVALESTNQVPLTWDIRQAWANERQYTGVDFLGVSYAAVPPLTHFQTNSTYFSMGCLNYCLYGMPRPRETKDSHGISIYKRTKPRSNIYR
ncbi:inosine-uridine preferring nucleoside hydrolase [Staphylococcus gallinarum]|uniref:Inosine-uridine preferring nucleoside hydrolase n=1 Tax=Staphylococcus gallinarum TaxID=1293 RepID=A0A380FN69_STAGA|nr:inosine-uridine preferring nucleoside hydrolase [Staphylococcus gallinarum]